MSAPDHPRSPPITPNHPFSTENKGNQACRACANPRHAQLALRPSKATTFGAGIGELGCCPSPPSIPSHPILSYPVYIARIWGPSLATLPWTRADAPIAAPPQYCRVLCFGECGVPVPSLRMWFRFPSASCSVLGCLWLGG
jgi:hypothetical protein